MVVLVAFGLDMVIEEKGLHFIPSGSSTIFVGAVLSLINSLSGSGLDEQLKFDTETFSLFFLPPIILDAGFSLRKKGFISNLGTIVAYATLGTMVARTKILCT